MIIYHRKNWVVVHLCRSWLQLQFDNFCCIFSDSCCCLVDALLIDCWWCTLHNALQQNYYVGLSLLNDPNPTNSDGSDDLFGIVSYNFDCHQRWQPTTIHCSIWFDFNQFASQTSKIANCRQTVAFQWLSPKLIAQGIKSIRSFAVIKTMHFHTSPIASLLKRKCVIGVRFDYDDHWKHLIFLFSCI